ncbi:MAG: ABC transporter permease [Candidatus Margulisbacteria bacterium]|nr:ABC transporter permease [Candidatus Margulisiibacteriota bacterium]
MQKKPETTIEPHKKNLRYWKEIWAYRELFFFLSWRDILVRYKQTVFGIAWGIIRPLMTMIVFTFIFGKLARLPSNGIPYALLVFSGLLPWQLFSGTFTEASQSLINNSNLLTKVYFPRLIIPASTVLISCVDFLISFAIMLGLMLYYHFWPGWQILLLPLLLVFILITSMGAGFYISALNVKFRDFRYVVPFILQFGLYLSPVGFNSSIVPENLKFFYSLNPLVGIIEGFRFVILGQSFSIYWPGFILSVVITIFIFFYGIYYFRKMEREFADFI